MDLLSYPGSEGLVPRTHVLHTNPCHIDHVHASYMYTPLESYTCAYIGLSSHICSCSQSPEPRTLLIHASLHWSCVCASCTYVYTLVGTQEDTQRTYTLLLHFFLLKLYVLQTSGYSHYSKNFKNPCSLLPQHMTPAPPCVRKWRLPDSEPRIPPSGTSQALLCSPSGKSLGHILHPLRVLHLLGMWPDPPASLALDHQVLWTTGCSGAPWN